MVIWVNSHDYFKITTLRQTDLNSFSSKHNCSLMAHTSCSNLSNFCCNSKKYRDVMRPWWDLSKQSRASSVIWWWVKLSTPSARGRTFSGEWFVIMSWSLSSIWAVAYRQIDTWYIKTVLHETNNLKGYFWFHNNSVLPKLHSWNAWNDWSKKASKWKGKVTRWCFPVLQVQKSNSLTTVLLCRSSPLPVTGDELCTNLVMITKQN